METHENIKKYRKLRGFSQAELAEATGYSDRSSIAKIEAGSVDLPQSKISAFAKALGVSPAQLMGIVDEKPSVPDGFSPIPPTYKAPRSGFVPCGDANIEDEVFETFDDVPDYIKADFTLECEGDSMIGARIYEGDIVCIKRQDTINSGEIAAVRVDGEKITLKRVLIYSDHLVLQPENPDHKPRSFWEADMNRVQIIGKATHFISTVR